MTRLLLAPLARPSSLRCTPMSSTTDLSAAREPLVVVTHGPLDASRPEPWPMWSRITDAVADVVRKTARSTNGGRGSAHGSGRGSGTNQNVDGQRPTNETLGEAPVRLSAMTHEVPAILQDRFEWITVLECHRADPSQLVARQMTRRELLAQVALPLPSTAVESGSLALTLRDLRRLDPATSFHSPPTLLVRHGAILLNISRLGLQSRATINAIIQYDRLYLLARTPDDRSAASVHRELIRLSSSSGAAESLPFEFVALEAALLYACSELHATTNALSQQVAEELRLLATVRAGSALAAYHRRCVRELTQRVGEESALGAAIAAALSRAVDDTHVLSGCCLSKDADVAGCGEDRASGAADGRPTGVVASIDGADSPPLCTIVDMLSPPSAPHVHGKAAPAGEAPQMPATREGDAPPLLERARSYGGGSASVSFSAADVEIILESYLHEVAHVGSALRSVGLSLDRAHTEIAFQMDAARNRLLHFEVIATSVGTAMSVGAVISGILGMNLKSELFNKEEWVFDFTAIGIVVLCFMTSAFLLCLLRYDWADTRPPKAGSSTSAEINPGERPPTWQHAATIRDTFPYALGRDTAGTRAGTFAHG